MRANPTPVGPGRSPGTAQSPPALDRLSPEAELVVRCATTRRPRDGDGRIAAVVAADPDWERVVEIACANGVGPLVSRQFDAREIDLPGEARSALRRSSRRTSMRGLRLADELRSIVDDLDQAGIRALPFKGPTLAIASYGDLALRPFRDLDLLVPRADLTSAVDRLQSRGYEWTVDAPRLDDAVVLGGPFTRPLAAEFRLHRGPVTVELRPRVGAPSRPFDVATEALWGRRDHVAMAGRTVPALSPEDRLLVLAYHGVKHRWDRLKWVCDVAETTRAADGLEWGTLLERARASGARRRLSVALVLADALFETDVPSRVLREARSDPRAVALADEAVDAFSSDPLDTPEMRAPVRYNALASDSAAAAAATVLCAPWFHPTLAEYRLRPLPGALHPLYYPLRPVRAAAVLAGSAVEGLRDRLPWTSSSREG